jgi:hypothetical protein
VIGFGENEEIKVALWLVIDSDHIMTSKDSESSSVLISSPNIALMLELSRYSSLLFHDHVYRSLVLIRLVDQN